MTNKELAAALRCCRINDCENCPARSTAIRTSAPRCYEVLLSVAADALENSETHVAALQQEIENLRGQIILRNDELLKLREQVPRWIPVTERLPEKWQEFDGETLVKYMIYSPDFGVDIGNFYAKARRWLCMGLPGVVTHWMPIPEPPKEDA